MLSAQSVQRLSASTANIKATGHHGDKTASILIQRTKTPAASDHRVPSFPSGS